MDCRLTCRGLRHGVALLALACEISALQAAQTYYRVVDLGSLGGQSGAGEVAIPTAINNFGEVAGYAFDADGRQRAFFYTGGVMTALTSAGEAPGIALDVNDTGTVVGGFTVDANGDEHPFSKARGEARVDLSLLTDVTSSRAVAINNGGAIVGVDTNLNGISAWNSYLMTTVPWLVLGEFEPVRLNDAGQIIGSSYEAEESLIILDVVQRGVSTLTNLTPGLTGGLNLLDYWNMGYGINDSGEVVGSTGGDVGAEQAIYTKLVDGAPGAWVGLGVFALVPNYPYDHKKGVQSRALAINASGQIVGASWRTYDWAAYEADPDHKLWIPSSLSHAFLATVSNGTATMVDLNDYVPFDPGWVLWSAADINASGQIACQARGSDGLMHAVLLNPTAEVPSPTPAPPPPPTPAPTPTPIPGAVPGGFPASTFEPAGDGTGSLRVAPDGTLGLLVTQLDARVLNSASHYSLALIERAPDGSFSDPQLIGPVSGPSSAYRGAAPGPDPNVAFLFYTAESQPLVLVLDGNQAILYGRSGGTWSALETSTAPEAILDSEFNVFPQASAARGADGAIHFVAFVSDFGDFLDDGAKFVYGARSPAGVWTWSVLPESIDRLNDAFFDFGWPARSLSLAIDAQGHDHIVYSANELYQITSPSSTMVRSDLFYLTNESGSWSQQTVLAHPGDYGDAGIGASLSVAPDGTLGLASTLLPRAPTGSPGAASLVYLSRPPGSSWSAPQTVASASKGYVAGDGERGTGLNPMLAFDADSTPEIVFDDHASQHFDGIGALSFPGQVRYATLVAGQWTTYTLVTRGEQSAIDHEIYAPVIAASAAGPFFAAASYTYLASGDYFIQFRFPSLAGVAPDALPTPAAPQPSGQIAKLKKRLTKLKKQFQTAKRIKDPVRKAKTVKQLRKKISRLKKRIAAAG